MIDIPSSLSPLNKGGQGGSSQLSNYCHIMRHYVVDVTVVGAVSSPTVGVETAPTTISLYKILSSIVIQQKKPSILCG